MKFISSLNTFTIAIVIVGIHIAKNTVVIIVAYILSIFSSTALIAINLIALIIII